jgi:polysaccharide export outer membrane protein
MSFRAFLAWAVIAVAPGIWAPGLAVAQPAAAPAAAATDEAYILGPEDELNIQVLGRTDFNVKPKVGPDGMIQLPYIGSQKAGGLTTNQLSAEIKAALVSKGFFNNPILSVDITSYASRYVTVLGEVNKPGLTPVDRPYHLSELLARVGGVRDTAADYVTLTPAKGSQQRLSLADLASGAAAADPLVAPGDKVYAPKAEMFYISGQVRAPGTYPVMVDMTLRQAIARGGGLTDLGSDKGVKVTHKGGAKPEKEKLDYKVQAGDVIVIGERLF